jgi:dienelactone hydrolase
MSHHLTRRELSAFILAGGVSAAADVPNPQRIVLKASDGVDVYAWRQSAKDKSLPAILLFHQAGSNHAEYSTIAPRLAASGYHSLALDQRSGGRMWGQPNQTASAVAADVDYRAALPDLEAALAWPSRQGFPARSIVWGSSYSAALVFLLAAKHPSSVAAVLAFSPGEYLGDNHSVRDAAAKVQAPVFVTSALDPEEISAARAIAKAVPSSGMRSRGSSAVQFVPRLGGVHGSSTLRQDKNPKGAEENWHAVEQFLAGLPRGK